MAQPFFTIGVPTYKRHDLLRETLNSILSQEFADFEVIVGNDYTDEILTGELIGITDPRIRYVNHPRNLREVGNMNALLEMATGRYFTWLFDDDLYEPGFLQAAHDCLVKTGFPPAFFSSFRMLRVTEEYQPRTINIGDMIELTGREFLRRYSARRPDIVSTCGLFDTAQLRSIVGGVEELSDTAIGAYCEYLFLVKCALLGRIVYMDAPFYVFRTHAGSWSESNLELEKHLSAGEQLVRRCAEFLCHPAFADDYTSNLLKICELHLIAFAYKSGRLEFVRKKFGVCAAFRAISRHWKESSKMRKLLLSLGGDDSFRVSFAFMKIQAFCNYLILFHFASNFYRSFR